MGIRKPALSILLIFVSSWAYSQKSKLNLTPYIGLNISTISDKEVEFTIPNQVGYSGFPVKPKPGFQGGLLLDGAITEHFSLTAGLAYSQKGYAFRSEGGGGGYGNLGGGSGADITRYTANYLEVPLTLRFSIRAKETTWFINAGSSFSYLLNYHNNSSNMFFRVGRVNINQERFQRKDAGLIAGAGFNFTSGSSEAHVEIRYAYGLANQFEQESPTGDPIRNRMISLMFGKSIHLIKRKESKSAD